MESRRGRTTEAVQGGQPGQGKGGLAQACAAPSASLRVAGNSEGWRGWLCGPQA